ncbi:hypothetical protein IKD82_02815 [Candidatus Saccharibacteria bacterium]|nr:hypothetical protein [Candidatus Saccharibacteria bacterium]
MENEQKSQKIPPIILIIIIIQIIIFVVLGVIIKNEITKNNKIENRDNEPSVSIGSLTIDDIDLPNNYIEDISHSLTEVMKLNNDNLNIPNSKITVRDNSITTKRFEEQNFVALSFIVDIPDLEQSYQIYYKYSSDKVVDDSPFLDNPRAILCLEEKSQIIYPNFNCNSNYPSDTRYRIIKDYANFLEFDNFSIRTDNENLHQINLKPFPKTADTTDAVIESYITQTKTAIQSLGVSPEIFTYHIIRNN